MLSGVPDAVASVEVEVIVGAVDVGVEVAWGSIIASIISGVELGVEVDVALGSVVTAGVVLASSLGKVESGVVVATSATLLGVEVTIG